MNWLLRRRFLVLLIAMLALLVVYPMLRRSLETRLFFIILLTMVFLSGLLTVFTDRRFRIIAFVLGIPMVIGVWSEIIPPGVSRFPAVVSFHLAACLFFVFIALAILRSIYREEVVSAD